MGQSVQVFEAHAATGFLQVTSNAAMPPASFCDLLIDWSSGEVLYCRRSLSKAIRPSTGTKRLLAAFDIHPRNIGTQAGRDDAAILAQSRVIAASLRAALAARPVVKLRQAPREACLSWFDLRFARAAMAAQPSPAPVKVGILWF
jgi:hypothetical protein